MTGYKGRASIMTWFAISSFVSFLYLFVASEHSLKTVKE
jgi:hypothetical protein